MNWPNFFAGILFSMLPRAYWRGWNYSSTADFTRSTLVSGLIQSVVSIWSVISRYKSFLLFRGRQLSFLAGTNQGTQLYMTGVLTFEYLLQPLTIILAYCAIEGVVRSVSAWVSDETYPMLLIKFLQVFQERFLRPKEKVTILADKVQSIEGPYARIRIASSLPKEGWRKSSTIAIQDDLYEVEAIEAEASPYKVAYVLQKKAEGTIIRGLYRYEIAIRSK